MPGKSLSLSHECIFRVIFSLAWQISGEQGQFLVCQPLIRWRGHFLGAGSFIGQQGPTSGQAVCVCVLAASRVIFWVAEAVAWASKSLFGASSQKTAGPFSGQHGHLLDSRVIVLLLVSHGQYYKNQNIGTALCGIVKCCVHVVFGTALLGCRRGHCKMLHGSVLIVGRI